MKKIIKLKRIKASIALGIGLIVNFSSAVGAPIEDGFYRGKYFGGDIKYRDQQRIKVIVETMYVKSSENGLEDEPLTLALLLKEKSNQAGLFIVDELPDGTHRWRAVRKRRIGQGDYSWELPGVISGEGEFSSETVSRGNRPELRLNPTSSGKSRGCDFKIRVRKAQRDRLQFLTLPNDKDIIVRDRLQEKNASNSLTINHAGERASGTIAGESDSEFGDFTLVDVDSYGGKILYSFYPTQVTGETASGKIPGHILSALAVFLKRDRWMFWDRRELQLINMNENSVCKRPVTRLKKRLK